MLCWRYWTLFTSYFWWLAIQFSLDHSWFTVHILWIWWILEFVGVFRYITPYIVALRVFNTNIYVRMKYKFASVNLFFKAMSMPKVQFLVGPALVWARLGCTGSMICMLCVAIDDIALQGALLWWCNCWPIAIAYLGYGAWKELVCFKRSVELRSRPSVGVLLDIRMGSKVDQNPLATGYWWK